MSDEKPIGKVTHYFDKIEVAAIELSTKLKKGEMIHFKGSSTDFEQEAGSMQIEHESVDKADAGQIVGMKVDQPVKENDLVYRVE